MTLLTDKIGEDFWIGANDIAKEGNWIWESDKSKLFFSDWHVGEPNTGGANEDCVKIRWAISLYRWNDARCEKLNLYISEKMAF